MIIALDVDGVLADFNASFIERCVQVTGKDLFPARPFDIPCWDYPEAYGYTKAETSAVWKDVKADDQFWYDLEPYPGVDRFLKDLARLPNDVYFCTSRPGIQAKLQTESWFKWLQFSNPTVLITSDKGSACRALQANFYIDDKNENCLDVVAASPATKTFMLARPWNSQQPGVPRIDNLDDFLKEI